MHAILYSGVLKVSWIVKRRNFPKNLKIISRLSCKVSILSSLYLIQILKVVKREISRVRHGSQVFKGLYKSKP